MTCFKRAIGLPGSQRQVSKSKERLAKNSDIIEKDPQHPKTGTFLGNGQYRANIAMNRHCGGNDTKSQIAFKRATDVKVW